MLERLIAQKKFTEAHDLRNEILAMEEDEKVKFAEAREKKVQVALSTMIVKQKVERDALEKKLNN